VLSEHGQIPPDYYQKIGNSFRAVLTEVWDALPTDEADLCRRVLTTLALLGETALVPQEVLPLMLEPLAPDPDDFDPPPLEDALVRLETAQLLERNRERRQLRLHPLIQDFAQGQWHPDGSGRLLENLARQLENPEAILAMPADRLGEIGRALEVLSKLDPSSAAGRAIADSSRMLRIEAHTLVSTADPISGALDLAQLAYAAAAYGQGELKAEAEEIARAAGQPYLRVRWTTTQVDPSMRHRLRGHGIGSGAARSALMAAPDFRHLTTAP
jgi:hypothetical protein